MFPPSAVFQSATPADCGPHVASFARRPSVRARASCMRMRERAWRAAQCAANKKRERSAKTRVGTLNEKKGAARAARPPRAMGAACGVLNNIYYIKERGAVYVLWCEEDIGQREKHVRHCVRNSTVPA